LVVTILGCGWLGKIVAQHLLSNDTIVYGSTRTPITSEENRNFGIQSFLFDLNENSQISSKILDKTDVLLISIPPLRGERIENYADKLCDVVSLFASDVNVIFTSSIGVYPMQDGMFDESFCMDVSKSEIFYAESALRSSVKDRLTILRLGGLIGDDRHPVYHLSGREVKGGNSPINLVHGDDVSRAILEVIDKMDFGKLYNLVYPDHPRKNIYYNELAKKKGLPPVKYLEEDSLNRTIDGTLISKTLGFKYNKLT
jgi:nucleoside-diphosphate-sugar epimerase